MTEPTTTDERPRSASTTIYKAGMSAALLACYIYAFSTPIDAAPGWTVCPTRLVTDLPCPSCGFGRGWIALANGEWMQAIELNIWSPVVFLGGMIVMIVLAVEALSNNDWLDHALKRYKKAVYVGIGVMVVVRYAALWALG